MDARTKVFLIIFSLMSLQMLLGMMQVKRYQKAVREMRGGKLIGIGHRKGTIRGGELLILAYDRQQDKVSACKSMRGRTIFAAFRERPELTGLSLREVRELGIEHDLQDMGRYRRRHPYNPEVLSKKKGALIQAVEAIDLRLKREAADVCAQDGVPLAEPTA